jgi:hypothetical protein
MKPMRLSPKPKAQDVPFSGHLSRTQAGLVTLLIFCSAISNVHARDFPSAFQQQNGLASSLPGQGFEGQGMSIPGQGFGGQGMSIPTCSKSSCYAGYCVNNKLVACDAADNSACDACDLYTTIRHCQASPSSCSNKYFGSYYYSGVDPTGKNPHWLIEPTVALRGVEDIAMGGAAVATTNPLWGRALGDAISGARGVSIRPESAALVMNSANYR